MQTIQTYIIKPQTLILDAINHKKTFDSPKVNRQQLHFTVLNLYSAKSLFSQNFIKTLEIHSHAV